MRSRALPASLDSDLGLLLRELVDRRLHHELGFTRFDRYLKERIDVAPRTARRWMQLARQRSESDGAVATAFRTGALTEMQSALVAEASTPAEVASVFLAALASARAHLAGAATGRAPDELVFELGVRSGGPPLLGARSGDVLLGA